MEREQILVVDDVELNRAILTEIFSKQYECIEAANGQAALEQLEKACLLYTSVSSGVR